MRQGGQWFHCDICKSCLVASPDQSFIDVAHELSPQCQAVPLHREASLHLPSWWQGHQKASWAKTELGFLPSLLFFILSHTSFVLFSISHVNIRLIFLLTIMVGFTNTVGHDACLQEAHNPQASERTDVAREQWGGCWKECAPAGLRMLLRSISIPLGDHGRADEKSLVIRQLRQDNA